MKKVKVARLAMGMMMALTGGLAVVGLVNNVAPAVAEEASETASTLGVTPMNQEIVLVPGESFSGSIKVNNPNTSKQNLKFSVKVGSFTLHSSGDDNGDYDVVDVNDVTDYNRMMEWITLEKEGGELAPNETAVIPFTINVPSDAPAGGQYATIIVKDETGNLDSVGGNTSIQSDVQTASIIYADVAGETRKEGKVLENNVPGFILSSPLQATSMVENDGNVHATVNYTLQVWPLFSDEEICTNEEEPSYAVVLPETKKYHVENCDLGVIGIYRAKQTVTIFGDTSTVERIVVLCPVWMWIIILAVIVLIIYLIVRRVNAKRR